MNHLIPFALSPSEETDIHMLPPLSLECIAAQHALEIVDILAKDQAVYGCGPCNKEYLGYYRLATEL